MNDLNARNNFTDTVYSSNLSTIDTTPPTAPTFDVVAGDNIIDQQERESGVLLSGRVEAGSRISLIFFEGDEVHHIVYAGIADSYWTYNLATEDYINGNLLEIGAIAIDAADNLSEMSLITIALPTATTFDVVAGDNIIDQQERESGVLLSGRVEAGSTIRLYFFEGDTIHHIVDASIADSYWAYNLATEDYINGDFLEISAIAIDAAGNVGTGSFIKIALDNTIIDAIPSYTLTADKTTVNEGDTVTFNLVTENVDAGTKIPFSFGGSISSADVLGGFKTTSFVVDANGKATLPVKFIKDKITEGAENLTLTLNSGESQSVAVKDTSVTPVVVKPTPDNSTSTVKIDGLTLIAKSNAKALLIGSEKK